jgi:hypothetical protein
MTDDDLITVVRDAVADVHAATPVAQIISRGRAVRAQRRVPAVAAAISIAAGTALVVATLLPSGRPESSPASARLADWTVAKRANGDIDVTINQLHNPAGLQRALRADGLPVTVSFYNQSPGAACQFDPINGKALNAVLQPGADFSNSSTFVFKPSALPAGAGLAVFLGAKTSHVSTPHGKALQFFGPNEIPIPRNVPRGTGISSSYSGVGGPEGHLRLTYSLTIVPVYAVQACTGSPASESW